MIEPEILSIDADTFTISYQPDSDRLAVFGKPEFGPNIVIHFTVKDAGFFHHQFSIFLENNRAR
tara:strand:+ start:7575 stop:7766 length:192 start_codon:yes stop_codon:yes gene_type:complete